MKEIRHGGKVKDLSELVIMDKQGQASGSVPATEEEEENKGDVLSEEEGSSEDLTLNEADTKLLDDDDAEIEDEQQSDDCSTCPSADLSNDQDENQIEEILRNINEPNSRYDWTTLAIRAGITTVLYPTQMAQILMQVTK